MKKKMMKTLKKLLLDSITEPDKKTFCPLRILAIAGIIQYLALSVHLFYKSGTFDYQAYAIGFAAIISGAGVALGLKKDTPAAAQDQPPDGPATQGNNAG